MSLRNKSYLPLFLPLIFFFVYPTAYAQGIIIPIPCDQVRRCPGPRPPRIPPPSNVPVKSIKIDTKISGQVATTRVEQVFENKTPYTLEGRYFFPIPEDASVEQFAIWENGKKLSGEVRSREEARRIYNEIVRRMMDPGLLEYAGRDLFQASIFPIPGNSEKKLEITYTQVLKSDSGTVSYRYPLGGPAGLEANPVVRGAERAPVGVSVSGTIAISADRAIRNIYSPSHSIDVNRKGETAATVSFESKGVTDDLRLFYAVSRAEFGLSLITYREAGKDGHFLLMLSPNEGIEEITPVAKDVIFVLDTSGSMQDDGKLEKARPALLFGIRSLHAGDRFNVISFSGEEHLMETGLVSADSAHKKTAEEFVARFRANGGTNINDALLSALKQFDGSDRPKMLVLLTDGLPTVGEQDVTKIISNVLNAKVKGLRLFPFGVGYDVNTRLLDKLGSENSGLAEYIQPKEDLEVRVSSFFNKVNSPVLSDVSIDFGGVKTEMVYPRKISDIFRGAQAVMIGRYVNDSDLNDITARLSGIFGGERRTFRYEKLDFPRRALANEFLPRLWASRRVGWLIEEIRTNGESKELKDEIVDLGTRYGIVTPYTSYLADDGSFRTRETAGNRFQIDGAAAAVITGEMREEKGKDAVRRSVQQNTLQSNMAAAPAASDKADSVFLSNTSQNRFIGTKNFINDNGKWVDAEFDPSVGLKIVDIRFGSEEYFELALGGSGIARYLSLGRNVVVVWDNKVFRVAE